MAYKVVVQPKAEADIARDYLYLAEHAPSVAPRWYRQVKSDIDSLAKMPMRCRVAPESALLGIELRQLHQVRKPGGYRIVFRVLPRAREVHVLAVRHQARRELSIDEILSRL